MTSRSQVRHRPTGDVEWYDPGVSSDALSVLCLLKILQTITTSNGKLVITMSEKRSHNLNFESGKLFHGIRVE
jgi:hypothetical protein